MHGHNAMLTFAVEKADWTDPDGREGVGIAIADSISCAAAAVIIIRFPPLLSRLRLCRVTVFSLANITAAAAAAYYHAAYVFP